MGCVFLFWVLMFGGGWVLGGCLCFFCNLGLLCGWEA